ncbi:hypothetical protein PsorP6_014163 [Peronosclerospora sorghi]|uniref:Uncharacterized protein n=1 Tax=Peronosclerospora sorghi TaxID=230839 RepID=A0ACC0VFY6_9STRA|nr:hypothetical protein PsorP6_014163 [Peronosclerospora sorghi]
MRIFLFPTVFTFIKVADQVNGHGYASRPRSVFDHTKGIYTEFVALTDASINPAFKGGIYNHAPIDNWRNFNDRWEATGYKTLAEMLDPLINGCGRSDDKAPPVDVSGFTEFWWQNDEYKEGLLKSHYGPCAIGCHQKEHFFHHNCAAKFTTFPAKIPFDYSKCPGKSILTFHWLALHQEKWQVYSTFYQLKPLTLSKRPTLSLF